MTPFRRRVLQHLRSRIEGAPLPLRIAFWDGEAFDFAPAPKVTIALRSRRVMRLLLLGDMGRLGQAYVEGDLAVDGRLQDILDVGVSIAERIGRSPLAQRAARLGPLVRPLARFRAKAHSKTSDAAAVGYHYDVSNAFYALWLDPLMIYSCAYFRTGAEDIATAQEQKLDHICRKLRLGPGDRLLDIGCGWGGLLRWAARRYGVSGVGVTLSRQQHEYAQARCAEERLDGVLEFRLQDYRDIPGEGGFSKVVSVGMAEAGRGFVLHDDENAARNAPDQEGVAYRVTFAPAAEVPPVNAPVMLMGKQVGSVTQSALQYDPQRRQIGVNATLVLEPRTIELPGGAAWSDPRAQMDDMLRALIGQGLRAELGRSPPVVGGAQVTLSIKPGPPGALGEGAVPEIPAAPGSGDISGVVAQAHDIMGKIDAIPFRRIADNVDAASAHLARIAGSPELKGTLTHVDRASADLEHVAVDLRRNLPSALASLRTALAQARSALASAQALLSARGATASAPGSGDLPRTLYEITRAARSLRELADLLDRDPSALLTGKETRP